MEEGPFSCMPLEGFIDKGLAWMGGQAFGTWEPFRGWSRRDELSEC